jgi:hypothetical protein
MEKAKRIIDVGIIATAMLLGVLAIVAQAADEITVTSLLKVDNGEFTLERRIQNQKIDQTGSSMSYNIQTIGTGTHEQITIIADVATNGVSYFRNITTNTNTTVDIGTATGGVFCAFIRLKATEIAIMRLHPTNNIYSRANGGAVQIEAWVNED